MNNIELDNVAASVSSAMNEVLNDGYSTAALADLLGYDNTAMVYQITNPNKAQMPPVPRFLHAARHLTEQGCIALSNLAIPAGFAIVKSESVLVNHSLDDEMRELFKTFYRLEEAISRRDRKDVDHELRVMSILHARIHAEAAAAMSEGVFGAPVA